MSEEKLVYTGRKPSVTAKDVLNKAEMHMQDRASAYDAPEGERSMARTVLAFNALTGNQLTETDGWLFMVCLKIARSNQGEFKLDNYEDGAAYMALAGESASNVNDTASIYDERRMDIIGQNGNDGAVYASLNNVGAILG